MSLMAAPSSHDAEEDLRCAFRVFDSDGAISATDLSVVRVVT
jgi:Ca2+-binding EF-hand superfamily protein